MTQSGSDFNEGKHNLAGVQELAQHRPCLFASFSFLVFSIHDRRKHSADDLD